MVAPRKHIAGVPAVREYNPLDYVENQHCHNDEYLSLKINLNESRRFNERSLCIGNLSYWKDEYIFKGGILTRNKCLFKQ